MLFLIPISLIISVVSGHATLSPPVASSRYYTADVRITHGLNKTATDMIVVTIPESISSVRPQRVAGWTISMNRVPLPGAAINATGAHSAGSHGASSEEPTDRVSEVIWSGNSLPDEYFESFGLSLRLPAMKDGEKLYLSVSQRSASLGGAWMNWSYVPGVANSGPEGYPAPFVTFQSASTPVNGSTSSNTTAKATSGAFSSFARSMGWMVVAAALLL